MNCKPGDLAVVVREDPGCEENIGAFLRVLDADLCAPGEWRCVCEYRSLMCLSVVTNTISPTKPGEEVWFMDSQLRPIRDPGEDAVDETLEWLPAPPREKETA